MERKVYADIELHPVEDTEDSDLSFVKCDPNICFYEYPLKIMLPNSISDSVCQWIYPVNFGGGLVEGDYIDLNLKVGNRCCALLASLSFPKVYRCENGIDSQQHMTYKVCSNALLCVLPDPLVCYKDACCIQTQTFYLTPESNVVSLDWYTSGRHERGERWEFQRLKTVSTFYINDKLAFKEAQYLQNTPNLSIKQAMKSYNVSGTCIVIGPYLSFLYNNILIQLNKSKSYGEKCNPDTLFAVSPLILHGEKETIGCIIRFTAESLLNVIKKLEELLEPLFEIIGGNPLKNK